MLNMIRSMGRPVGEVPLVSAITMALVSTLSAQDFENVEFQPDNTDAVSAQQGEILVPENRSNPNSRQIPIRFLRFATRSKKPAAPIVYLAGGPGGSGSGAARGRRWVMFDRLRDVADVIILDQRGTGLSDTIPECRATINFPADTATTREVYTRLHRRALEKCLKFWRQAGVDLSGYTTWESAADIDAVRAALGAERLNLLGISYGTHLALATLKRFPERIDRLVLVSAEGLNQTVKRPALTDTYFDRLQEAINADPAAAGRYPDVRGLIQGVLNRVEEDPPRLRVRRSGKSAERLVGRFELQVISGYMLSDPSRVSSLLEGYSAAAEGRFGYFAWFLQPSVSVRGMPTAMDLASGISPERLAQVAAESDDALLGDALNFPVPHLLGAVADLDLGDEFRAEVVSDRPALFFSGTLDGRTYPEAHAQLAAGFKNGAVVTIENAGHNLFFSHPQVVELIAEFLNGQAAVTRTLTAVAPKFVND